MVWPPGIPRPRSGLRKLALKAAQRGRGTKEGFPPKLPKDRTTCALGRGEARPPESRALCEALLPQMAVRGSASWGTLSSSLEETPWRWQAGQWLAKSVTRNVLLDWILLKLSRITYLCSKVSYGSHSQQKPKYLTVACSFSDFTSSQSPWPPKCASHTPTSGPLPLLHPLQEHP